MRYSLNRYYDTIAFNYVNEIFLTISRDIIIAAEKDFVESFNELLDFLIYNLKTKSFNKSISGFSKSATAFVYIFPNLKSNYKKIFLKKVFASFITNISVSNDYEKIDKKYIELSYLPLINILKIILQDDDYDLFNIAIDEFKDTIFKLERKGDENNTFFSLSPYYYVGYIS